MKSSRQPSPDFNPRRAGEGEGPGGFTLIEVLVAVAVFAILAALLLSITSEASRIWARAESQKARRQAARIILETMTRDLEAAAFPINSTNANSVNFLLNTNLPSNYLNRDAAFWQTSSPSEISGGMADVGYFVQWKDKAAALCRYYVSATSATGDSIFQDPARELTDQLINAHAGGLYDTNYAGLLAENIIGLWITVYDSTNGVMTNYNSRTTTNRPSAAQVAIAVIDPRTAQRIGTAGEITSLYGFPPETFASNLPAALRDGVQIFKTRVEFQASQSR